MMKNTVKAFLAVIFAVVATPLALAQSVIEIEPGEGVQEALQEALIMAEPGSVIELKAGRYEFTGGLSLDVENITLRGAGMNETVLSFAGQTSGSEGS